MQDCVFAPVESKFFVAFELIPADSYSLGLNKVWMLCHLPLCQELLYWSRYPLSQVIAQLLFMFTMSINGPCSKKTGIVEHCMLHIVQAIGVSSFWVRRQSLLFLTVKFGLKPALCMFIIANPQMTGQILVGSLWKSKGNLRLHQYGQTYRAYSWTLSQKLFLAEGPDKPD